MRASHAPDDTYSRRIGLAVAVALHVAVLAALLTYTPVRSALHDIAPLMVSWIVAPTVDQPDEPPQPLPVKPAAKPLPARPNAPAPLVAVTAAPATAIETPVPDVTKALPPIQEAPSSTAPAAPSPVTPPGFDAAYLDNPPPAYPPLARRAGEQGRVLLRVLVAVNGTAESVELRSGSGSARLDNAALETVKRWRFVPARQAGVAVAAWVLVPINFKLEN